MIWLWVYELFFSTKIGTVHGQRDLMVRCAIRVGIMSMNWRTRIRVFSPFFLLHLTSQVLRVMDFDRLTILKALIEGWVRSTGLR